MSDYFEVEAVLPWMLNEIEAEEAPTEAEPVQHFDFSNIKTILVEEKPLDENSVVKAKEIYVEREEVDVEGAATSINAGEITVQADKVNEVQNFDWNNIKTILVEEKPLKVEMLLEAKVIPLKCQDKPADTYVKAADMPVVAEGIPVQEENISVEGKVVPEETKEVEIIQHFDCRNLNAREEFQHFDWLYPKRILVEERPLDQCKVSLQFGDDDVDHHKEFFKGDYSVSNLYVNKLESKTYELEEKENINLTHYKTENEDDEAMGSRECFPRPRTGPPLLMLNKLSCQPRPSRSQKNMFFGVTWGFHMDVDPVLLWKDPLELFLEDFEESDNVVYRRQKDHHAVEHYEVVDVGTGEEMRVNVNKIDSSTSPRIFCNLGVAPLEVLAVGDFIPTHRESKSTQTISNLFARKSVEPHSCPDNMLQENMLQENMPQNILQEKMPQEEMPQSILQEMLQEKMPQNILQAKMTQEEMRQENMLQENMLQENMLQENMLQENMPQNILQENMPQEEMPQNILQEMLQEKMLQKKMLQEEMPQEKMPQEKTTTPKSSSFGGMWRKMKKFFRGKK